MRESRTYGSGRGACHEMHVPTATETPRVHHAARRRGGGVADAARAQQAERVRRIGVLMTLAADDPESRPAMRHCCKASQELGWTVGRNMRIDYRWGAGDASATADTLANWSRLRRT